MHDPFCWTDVVAEQDPLTFTVTDRLEKKILADLGAVL